MGIQSFNKATPGHKIPGKGKNKHDLQEPIHGSGFRI